VIGVETAPNQDQQMLRAQVARASENIAGLEDSLRVVDSELEAMSDQRRQHQLLNDICESLDELHGLGASALFWGEQPDPRSVSAHMGRAREIASAFQNKIAAIEERRRALRENIQQELTKVDWLNEELAELQEQEERRRNEFVIEREVGPIPYRSMVMPWSTQGEDEHRLRKAMLAALLLAGMFGSGTALWELPIPDRTQEIEIPERLVKLVKQQQPKPVPKLEEKKPEPKEEEKKPEAKEEEKKIPEEQIAKEQTPKPAVEPVREEKKQARATAEKAGVLAFKSSLADLMDDSTPTKLGAEARINDSGQQASGGPAQRSLVVAQAQGGSGGINTAALSRNAGGPGGAGSKLSGVAFTRVESGIGADMKEADRPLSKGTGPSRTDEEIQIVFDRYKAALYRIYNRELRNDPTLQGKMILRITIEPDGQVSACKVESTDLGSPALVAEVVDRVKKFNFGAKDGVPRVSILYPIDFLPAG
jgi:outer membrane biosynthesis protein TonB